MTVPYQSYIGRVWLFLKGSQTFTEAVPCKMAEELEMNVFPLKKP